MTPERFLKIGAVARSWPAILIAYTAIAVAIFIQAWIAPANRWIGVDGDTDSTMWSLSWAAYSLTHLANPFLSDWIFYPTGTNVLWANADAPLALGWLAAPITLLAGPIVAYNVLQTLCLSLSAFFAYLAIARFVRRPWAALLGALIYGFGPYMFGTAYAHMALGFAVGPPLVMILIHRLLVRRDISPITAGIAAGLIEAFQLLVSQELVATTTLVALIATLWLAATARILRLTVPWRAVLSRTAIAGGVAAGVFLVLDGYPLYVLFRGPGRITHTPIRPFGMYSTDIFNFVIPPATTHIVHNAWTEQLSKTFPGVPSESGAYLGIALLLVLVFTVLRWGSTPAVLFAGGSLVLVALISLGPHVVHLNHVSHLALPWILVANVPVLNDILTDRLSLYIDLFAALLFAIFLDRAWSWPSAPARAGAGVAAAVSLLLLAPTVPWVWSTAHVPEMFEPGTVANRYLHAVVPDGGVLLVLPSQLLQLDHGYSMLWQATDGMRLRNVGGDLVHGNRDGYLTMDPEPSALSSAVAYLQAGKAPPASKAAPAQVRSDLDAMHVRAVIAGPMPRLDLAEQYFDELLGAQPVRTGGVLFWPTCGAVTRC